MVFLVRGNVHRRFRAHIVASYDYLTDHIVLFHRRIIYH